MKVRISANSIRFRLKQSEVRRFSEENLIKEIIAFGPALNDQLSFVLQQGNSTSFNISYEANTILLSVPPAVCHTWVNTEQVGFEEKIDTGKGELIKILVEKDFACLDASPVENEDTFPNPNMTC